MSAELAREIDLHGRSVAYLLRHSRRKTLGLRVDQTGLRVAAPLRMPQRLIDAFLRDHSGWVIRTLDDWTMRPAPAGVALVDGAVLPLFGQPCRVHVSRGRSRVQWLHAADGHAVLALCCTSRQSVARAALAAIKARALAHFSACVARDAARLGVVAPPVRLTSARTRWGSCSARAIRLNWRLVHVDASLIDYVVAHEVAHLQHMNHSPAFWSVVESLYPSAREARTRLREVGRRLPELIDDGSV